MEDVTLFVVSSQKRSRGCKRKFAVKCVKLGIVPDIGTHIGLEFEISGQVTGVACDLTEQSPQWMLTILVSKDADVALLLEKGAGWEDNYFGITVDNPTPKAVHS